MSPGSLVQKRWLFAVVILFWTALGLKIELEKEARKAQQSSLLQNGIATQLTKAKAQIAKDSADEFLHEQLSGHPDHFAQRNWVSWQLLLVAAQACQQVTPCPFNTSLSPKAANVHSSINSSPQFVTTADSAILKDAEFVYDGFTVVDQTGVRCNVGFDVEFETYRGVVTRVRLVFHDGKTETEQSTSSLLILFVSPSC